jgi:hypothetical protein
VKKKENKGNNKISKSTINRCFINAFLPYTKENLKKITKKQAMALLFLDSYGAIQSNSLLYSHKSFYLSSHAPSLPISSSKNKKRFTFLQPPIPKPSLNFTNSSSFRSGKKNTHTHLRSFC